MPSQATNGFSISCNCVLFYQAVGLKSLLFVACVTALGTLQDVDYGNNDQWEQVTLQ